MKGLPKPQRAVHRLRPLSTPGDPVTPGHPVAPTPGSSFPGASAQDAFSCLCPHSLASTHRCPGRGVAERTVPPADLGVHGDLEAWFCSLLRNSAPRGPGTLALKGPQEQPSPSPHRCPRETEVRRGARRLSGVGGGALRHPGHVAVPALATLLGLSVLVNVPHSLHQEGHCGDRQVQNLQSQQPSSNPKAGSVL